MSEEKHELSTSPTVPAADHQIHSFGPYIKIWLVLLVLTAVTVFVSWLQLGRLAIWVALTIASIKGGLVVLFFMHLKEEESMFKYMFLMAMVILAIFIGMTLFDTLYR